MHADAAQEFPCLIATYHFESDVLEALAARAREPERGARRRRGGERRIEAHFLETGLQFLPEKRQPPEQAQAALDFEQQRLRRLERNPRRELARPGADRLERGRRQERETQCDPEHEPAFSSAGRAVRRPERRGA